MAGQGLDRGIDREPAVRAPRRLPAFGTISSLYGLSAHFIDRTQFSLLVTVVVLSAMVPTVIAQHWFTPDVEAERVEDAQPERSANGRRPVEHVPAPARVPKR